MVRRLIVAPAATEAARRAAARTQRDRQVPSADPAVPAGTGVGPIRPASPCDSGSPADRWCRKHQIIDHRRPAKHRRVAACPGGEDFARDGGTDIPSSPNQPGLFRRAETVAICSGSDRGRRRGRQKATGRHPSPRPRACSAGTTRRFHFGSRPRCWLRSSTAAATRHPRPTPHSPAPAALREQFGEVFRYRQDVGDQTVFPGLASGSTRGAAPPSSSTSVTSLGAVARSRGRLLPSPMSSRPFPRSRRAGESRSTNHS